MRRRQLIRLIAGVATLARLSAGTQRSFAFDSASGRVPHVGILDGAAAGGYSDRHYWQAFRDQLRELGYLEGKTIALDFRWGNSEPGRLAQLADELVRMGVDVIVCISTGVAQVAKSATTRIPIVVPLTADPVAAGLVASLARPGGNVTGLTTISAELSAKRLELAKELVPEMRRAALLWDQGNRAFALVVEQTTEAARSYGLALQILGIVKAEDLDPAFTAMTREGSQAVIVAVPAGRLGENPARITDLAASHKLPAVYAEREYARAGGLLSYGPSYPDLFRRAARYVDKIIKGAQPSELPVEAPARLEMVINLGTAKALGIALPTSLIARADEVIE